MGITTLIIVCIVLSFVIVVSAEQCVRAIASLYDSVENRKQAIFLRVVVFLVVLFSMLSGLLVTRGYL